MKLLFVINPVAGGSDHTETIALLKQVAEEKGYESKFLLTNGKNDESEIKRCLDKFKPDRLIAGGGDGTLRMIGELIHPYNLAMGILPLGSANGLATALAIPSDPIQAFEQILQSTEIKRMDMLKFNKRHLCIHLADIGVNALIVKRYEESGLRGMMGYAKNLLSSIQDTELMKINIEADGHTIRKEGFMMAFANAHKYGTGVQISEGSVTDGKFEICNVERIALDSAIKAGLTILNVFIDKDMFSDVISCREAEVSIDKKSHFQIDGEYMGEIDRLHVSIVPGAIKLIM